MTLPNERRNAVVITEKFLRELLDPKQTPGVPKAIRQRASSCLRHYPSIYSMGLAANLAPAVFGEWDSEWKSPEQHSPHYYDLDRNK